jgi:CheY-like chemotaxis protein
MRRIFIRPKQAKFRFGSKNGARTRVTESDGFFAGKRCLVLDDEFLIALDIQQILESAGAASVTCVGSVEDALEALAREPKFDLGILDVRLGGTATGNSLTVAAALAQRQTPFIFLTGMRAGDVASLSFPAVPVVEKPYQATVLLEVLRRILAR